MLSKLFAIALAFVALSNATLTIVTYGDKNCTTAPFAVYMTNQASAFPSTPETRGCLDLNIGPSGGGPWIKLPENTPTIGDPTTAIPQGMQVIKVTNNSNCNFGSYEIFATNKLSGYTVIGASSVISVVPSLLNVTVSCANGKLQFLSCAEEDLCVGFTNVANSQCSVATTTILNFPYSAFQTTCGTIPPSSAPTAAPGTSGAPAANAPTKAPAKASNATSVSVAVGAILAVFAALL